MIRLKPSEIFYSQDSISNRWGLHTPCSDTLIGETLDKLLTGSVSLDDIPIITAVIINGKLHTTDNRRLWVFRKAEEFGYLHEIEVFQGTQQNFRTKRGTKFTTNNDGISIRIRGDPGGRHWRTWKPNTSITCQARNGIEDSICNKTVIAAQNPSINTSSYRNYNCSKPRSVCKNNVSRHFLREDDYCESPLAETKVQLSRNTRSNHEQEATIFYNSSFEPTSRFRSLRVHEPSVKQSRTKTSRYDNAFSSNYDSTVSNKKLQFVNQSRRNAIQESFGIKTFPENQHQSPYKSSYGKAKYTRHSYVCDNAFLSPSFRESTVSNKLTEFPTFVRSNNEKEPTLRNKSSFEPTSRKRSFRGYEPLVNQRRNNVIQDAFCNNTFTADQYQSTYKSSYGNANYSRPIYVCESAFSRPSFRGDNHVSSNTESTLSDKEFQYTTFIRSKAEKEPTLRNKSSFEPTSRKRSFHGYEPLVNQIRNNAIQDDFCNNTFTADQHQNTYKSSYGNAIYSRPIYVCESALSSPSFRGDNNLSIDTESTLSDKEFQYTTFIKSNSEEEETLRNKSAFEPTLRKTSLRICEPPVKHRITNDIQDALCNNTFTADQYQSAYKSSYGNANYSRPSYVCENAVSSPCFRGDFSSNTDSSPYDKEIQYTTSKAEKEAILRNKSSFEPTFTNTLLRLYDTHVKEKRTNVIQSSFGYKTDKVVQHKKTYEAAYVNENYSRYSCVGDNAFLSPRFRGDNYFSSNLTSLVSDKEFQFSRIQRLNAIEDSSSISLK